MQAHYKGSMMIIGATFGFGMIPMLVQLMLARGFSADAITLYRFLVPLIIFMLWLRPARIDWPEAIRTLLLGAFAGTGMLFFMRALEQADPATVILLYYSYPFFSIVIGALLFTQRLSRNALVAALLILVAVSLTLNPQQIDVAHWPLLGASLLAPLSFALLIQYVSHPRRAMASAQRNLFCLAGTMLAILILTFGEGSQLPGSLVDWGWILLLGVFSSAVPQYLFMRGAPLAGGTRTANLSSLEVVIAMVLGVILLSEQISRLQVTAVLLIVLAQLIRQEGGQAAGRDLPPLSGRPGYSS
jgi:drug/metabolite transporter (DMT)-like permease